MGILEKEGEPKLDKEKRKNMRGIFPYGRLKEILSWFLLHNEFATSADLAKRFGISERTLRTDIRNLNEILVPYNSKIVQKRQKGYTLESNSYGLLHRLLREAQDSALDSADKRINLLIMTLMYEKDYVSQEYLANTVYVSVNTILNYLKTIRSILNEYSLSLNNKVNQGYRIDGSETDKRVCIMDLFEISLQDENFHLPREYHPMWAGISMEAIQKEVLEFSQDKGQFFSDYSLHILVWQISLAVSRIQNGHELETYQIPEDSQTKVFLEPLVKRLEELFHIRFSHPEKCYIYSCYILNAGNFPEKEVNMEYIRGLVTKILQSIYDCYQIDVRNDPVLIINLSQHLHSILQSKYYQINKKNPLLEVIRQNYLLFYEITETAVDEAFQNEQVTLNDDDISYICLHVGAAVKRYFDSRNIRKQRTLIVTPGGYSVASFLETQLNSVFEDRLEIAGKISSYELKNLSLENIDFIISTVPLKDVELPVIVIEIPMNKKNLEGIFQEIVAGKTVNSGWMRRLFRRDCFWCLKCGTRDDTIHEMSERLLKKGYVYGSFEDEVLEREKKIPTAMNDIIAIPHPLHISSPENLVAVGILDHPISWGDGHTAQIILMLALSENYENDMEVLYDLLVEITSHAELQQRLINSLSMAEFLDMIENFQGKVF